MVKQAHRHVGDERPRTAHVIRRGESTVIADNHMIGILRVDPDAMHVVVRHECRIGFKGAAAIHRQVQAHATHINAIGIHGIDAQLTEVHRARIRVALLGPRRAAIVRLVHPRHTRHYAARGWSRRCRSHILRGGRRTLRRRRRAFHGGIHNVRTLTEHVHRDAPQRTSGESGAGDLGPRVATIGRLPQRAAGATAVHAAGRAATLIRGREQDVRIGRRHHELARTRLVVHREHLLPALPAVGGLVHTALAAGTEQRPGGRHQHHLVVRGMHDDAIDVLRLR